MKLPYAVTFSGALPFPDFVLNPITALIVAVVHIYLSFGHLAKLFGGDVQWTHIWKGFGALAGAYVFAALASRGLARVRPTGVGGEEGRTAFHRPPGHTSV